MSVSDYLERDEDSEEFIDANDAFVRFEYLNQGGANVIFKIEAAERSDAKPWFIFVDRKGDGKENIVQYVDILNKVLRVNKGLDKTLRCDEVLAGFNNDVRPLFLPKPIKIITRSMTSGELVEDSVDVSGVVDLTKHLMEHEGVLLCDEVMTNLMSKCRNILPEKRPDGSISRDMRVGILLPDMSPTPDESITIEVKPKWLVQSPNAPLNAVRCRTCAMQVAKPKDTPKYLCPLRLVQGSSPRLHSWILDKVCGQLVEHTAPRILEIFNRHFPDLSMPTAEGGPGARPQVLQLGSLITSAIVEYLSQGDGKALLWHLMYLQGRLDRQGVCMREATSFKDTFDRNLRLAMTLRDCSMYITARYLSPPDDVWLPRYANCPVGEYKVDSKLGDLDFKSADKIGDWLAKEKELLDRDAYTKNVLEDLGCVLSEKKAR